MDEGAEFRLDAQIFGASPRMGLLKCTEVIPHLHGMGIPVHQPPTWLRGLKGLAPVPGGYRGKEERHSQDGNQMEPTKWGGSSLERRGIRVPIRGALEGDYVGFGYRTFHGRRAFRLGGAREGGAELPQQKNLPVAKTPPGGGNGQGPVVKGATWAFSRISVGQPERTRRFFAHGLFPRPR